MKADVRITGVFKDDSKPPKAVNLAFSMSRPEFLALIKPELEKTIRQTHEVIEKSNCKPSEIHHLVLVGGSCRIPAIRDRLQEEFGLVPDLDEDVLDLSVAVGAAMMAMSAGPPRTA